MLDKETKKAQRKDEREYMAKYRDGIRSEIETGSGFPLTGKYVTADEGWLSPSFTQRICCGLGAYICPLSCRIGSIILVDVPWCS